MRLHLGDDIREIDWPLGSIVYHRTADEPARGIVTGYHVRPDSILYAVSWGNRQETSHYAFELSATHEPHFGGSAAADGGEASGPAGA